MLEPADDQFEGELEGPVGVLAPVEVGERLEQVREFLRGKQCELGRRLMRVGPGVEGAQLWAAAHFQHVPVIDAWVPLFLFSVLFGLSMDYQVFLMSRIRERFDQTGSTRDAVSSGVASTARIITGAALIIIAVFSGFASGQMVAFQQMGFGVAVALFLDATIVRSVVLPSVLSLLGDRCWYLPRWLDWLPRVEVSRHPQAALSTDAG